MCVRIALFGYSALSKLSLIDIPSEILQAAIQIALLWSSTSLLKRFDDCAYSRSRPIIRRRKPSSLRELLSLPSARNEICINHCMIAKTDESYISFLKLREAAGPNRLLNACRKKHNAFVANRS